MRPIARPRLLPPLLALLALNAVVGLVFTLPRTIQERSVEARRDTLRKDVERRRREVEAQRARAEAIRLNQIEQKAFYERVASSGQDSFLGALEEIEARAQQTGIRRGNRSYSPAAVKGAKLVRFRIQMPVRGSYRELKAFLQSIEGSEHLLTVDSLRVSERQEAQATQAQLDMTLSAYFQGDLEEGAGAR